MARFSLRKQDKIRQSLGDAYLKLLMESLKLHFANNTEIIEQIYVAEKYKILHVDNCQKKTDSTFEFYVISKTYDVYNLAYKSCIG